IRIGGANEIPNTAVQSDNSSSCPEYAQILRHVAAGHLEGQAECEHGDRQDEHVAFECEKLPKRTEHIGRALFLGHVITDAPSWEEPLDLQWAFLDFPTCKLGRTRLLSSSTLQALVRPVFRM